MILVGTSGWSFDDWVGPVYPKHLRSRRDAWLPYYARTFATVEVNSTFYQLPMAKVVEGWVERAEALGEFEYSLKVPRRVTHGAMPDGDREAMRDGLQAFRDRVEPLRASGRLGAVLLQVSPHLHGGPEERDLLAEALDELDPLGDVAVELRHRTWTRDDDLDPEARELLVDRGVAVCTVDGPSFPEAWSGTDHAYVRFHGRNREAWFQATDLGDHARYDYRYDRDELRPWADRLREAGSSYDRVRVYFNNHPGGEAFHDADRLREMLDLPRPDRPRDGQSRLDGF